MNPSDPGARLDDAASTPDAQNQPPSKSSPLLQPWRASPNLSDSPVEPSPPNPDMELQEADSPLKPMTADDMTSLSEVTDELTNTVVPLTDTNQTATVQEDASTDGNQVSPPLPGNNMTMAPSMNLSTENLVESPKEESRHLWRITPRLFAQTLWDSNVYITKTNPVASMMTSVGLGARFEVGDYRDRLRNFLSLGYFATYNMYSAASQENALNQLLAAEGQYAWTSLTAKYRGSAIYINGPSRDTGSFVKGTYIVNSLNFEHDYSPKTILKLGLSQRGTIFSGAGLQDNEFYDLRLSALYRVTPKITLGPDVVAGVNLAQNSPDQRFQSVNMNANYELTGKVTVKAKGGFMVNEYASGGQAAFGTSIFDLGAQYTPKAGTSLNLMAYRNLNNSAALVGQDFIATGFSLSVIHTVLTRWQPQLQLGYENDQYIGNLPSIPSGRVDNYYFLTPALAYNFLTDDRLKLRIFYTIRTNSSNQEQSYGWQDTQVGVQLSSTF